MGKGMYCSKCLKECSFHSNYCDPIKSIMNMFSALTLTCKLEKPLSNCCMAEVIGVNEAILNKLK